MEAILWNGQQYREQQEDAASNKVVVPDTADLRDGSFTSFGNSQEDAKDYHDKTQPNPSKAQMETGFFYAGVILETCHSLHAGGHQPGQDAE